MTTQTESTKHTASEVLQPDGGVRTVARLPILDTFSRLHGYELLFRGGNGSDAPGGLDKLTGGHMAFVKLPASALSADLTEKLPAAMTVIEVVEPGEPDKDLIANCQKLKSQGYRLALGNSCWKPGFEPLLEVADYIKVDFNLYCEASGGSLHQRFRHAAAALVAEKIESQDEYRQARAEGFTLFQGYYFCYPELIKNRKLPGNQIAHIKILELLQREPFDMNQVSEWVKRDASLTLRLLRLANSPLCAIRQEVRSIELALMVVGEDAFRRIAALAITSELNSDRPTEVLRMAFVRGRFCEMGARLCDFSAQEQYLLGMLSMLPAMLCLPMKKLTPELPLRDEIRVALDGTDCPERALLDWLEAHERGDWAGCDAVAERSGLKQEKLATLYTDALAWAETVVQFAD